MKEFQNITEKEIKTVGVQSLPTRPNQVSRFGEPPMSADELKRAFDALAVLVAGRVNELQNELNGKGEGRAGDAVAIPTITHLGGGASLNTLYELAAAVHDLGDYIYVWNNVVAHPYSLNEYIDYFFKYVNSNLAGQVSFERSGTSDSWKIILRGRDGSYIDGVELNGQAIAEALEDSVLDGAVLKASSVGGEKLIDGSMSREKIADGSVVCEKLAAGAVTAEKLAAGSVSTQSICDGSVTSEKICDGAVDAQKLCDGAVGEEKLSGELRDSLLAAALSDVRFDADTGALNFIFAGGAEKSVDLPTELIVKGGYYSSSKGGTIVLELTNGDEIKIPVSALTSKLISMPGASVSDIAKIPVVSGVNQYELRSICVEYESQGLEFTLSEDGAYYILCGIGTCVDKKIIVPRFVDGIPVTKVNVSNLVSLTEKIELVLQDGIDEICDRGLAFSMNIIGLTLPRSLKRIGTYAFQMCGAQRIELPEGLEEVGAYAFCWCQAQHITLPASLASISNYAFGYATSVRKFTVLGSGVKALEGLFDDNSGLHSYNAAIYVPKSLVAAYREATNWSAYADRIFSDGGCVCDVYCHGEAGSEEIEFAKSDGDRVRLPVNAPRELPELTQVDRGKLLVADGSGAVVAKMPVGVRFASDGLALVLSGNSVSVGGVAYPAYAVSGVGMCADTDIIIPEVYGDGYIVQTNDAALANNSGLVSVVFPASFLELGYYTCGNDVNLKKVTFGENSSLESIGSWAFYNCSSLEEIEISEKVTQIMSNAFDGCSSLSKVVCHALTPPVLGCLLSYVNEIFVPENCVAAYKAATNWSQYADKIKPIETLEALKDEIASVYTTHVRELLSEKEERAAADLSLQNGVDALSGRLGVTGGIGIENFVVTGVGDASNNFIEVHLLFQHGDVFEVRSASMFYWGVNSGAVVLTDGGVFSIPTLIVGDSITVKLSEAIYLDADYVYTGVGKFRVLSV